MAELFGRAAVFAALLIPALVRAEDVTLTSRDGALAVSGELNGYDGEFYRLATPYGPLTVDAEGVTCEGPACPELTARKAMLTFTGSADLGGRLLAPLLKGFAKAEGWRYEPGPPARLVGPAGDVLAEIRFQPADPEAAHQALVSGKAELGFAALTEPDLGSQSVALDAMVPIVAPDNPVPRISTTDLARVLAGEVKNWSEIGGPDMPLVLHGLPGESDLGRALRARLGRDLAPGVQATEPKALAEAVAHDPWAIAVTGRSLAGAARVLTLTDSCGFALSPGHLAVKAQDYPLTLPVYLLKPRHRLPLLARDFLDFLATPAAQAIIAETGLTDRSPERLPLADGARLIPAIKGAGEETRLEDLKALVAAMEGGERLSLTFRFLDGQEALDGVSRDGVSDLAQMLEAGLFKGKRLQLVGFSDGADGGEADLRAGQARAEAVRGALEAAAPDLAPADLPEAISFGAALPIACDKVPAGRRLNRRVEVWIRADFDQGPAPDAEGNP